MRRAAAEFVLYALVSRVGSFFHKAGGFEGARLQPSRKREFENAGFSPGIALVRLDSMEGRPSAAKAACVAGPNGMAEAMPLQGGPRDK
jgi:hypothetical protein